jgi:hypothetical protein
MPAWFRRASWSIGVPLDIVAVFVAGFCESAWKINDFNGMTLTLF